MRYINLLDDKIKSECCNEVIRWHSNFGVQALSWYECMGCLNPIPKSQSKILNNRESLNE